MVSKSGSECSTRNTSSTRSTSSTEGQTKSIPIVSNEAMRVMLEERIISLQEVEEVLISMIDSGTLEESQGKHIMRSLFSMWDIRPTK